MMVEVVMVAVFGVLVWVVVVMEIVVRLVVLVKVAMVMVRGVTVVVVGLSCEATPDNIQLITQSRIYLLALHREA